MSEVLFCLKCNGEMERGILALVGHDWFKFYPLKDEWHEVKNPGKQVLASRCRQCGHM
jgi:hypothetical protein